MLGREGDLVRLVEVHATASPDGRLACVTGEAGIGKSRVVEAVATSVAARGGAVLTARAFPAEGSIAYGPIVGLLHSGFARDDAVARLSRVPGTTLDDLERLVPLPEGMPPRPASVRRGGEGPAARARLLDAVAEALPRSSAVPSPDWLSLRTCNGRTMPRERRSCTSRAALPGVPCSSCSPGAPKIWTRRARCFGSRSRASPASPSSGSTDLDPATVRALVTAATGAGLPPWDPEALVAESEGLPLYLAEALVAGPGEPGDAPPRGVRALLLERLASVGETAAQVLSAAAVIGRSFDLDIVRDAAGRSDDETVTALEELFAGRSSARS